MSQCCRITLFYLENDESAQMTRNVTHPTQTMAVVKPGKSLTTVSR
jgi:hypothetical protein